MKSEAKNLVSRATNLEQQQTEANRKCEEMEKDLSECRLTIVQVKKMSYVCSFFSMCVNWHLSLFRYISSRNVKR